MHPDPTQTSDAELLAAIAHGDEQAFVSFYERYKLHFFHIIRRILPSSADAEEVLQDVFLHVWKKAADFDETRQRPLTWMIMLARRRAIDRLRTLKRRAAGAAREVTEEVSAAENPIQATSNEIYELLMRRYYMEEMLYDDFKEVTYHAIDKAEENKVRAILDTCMAEINNTRRRMLEDQEDIDRLTIEARTILSQLQTA